MSKGPGKWQKMILERLEQEDYFYLITLLPIEYDRNDYKALFRAAHKLYDDGKIGIRDWHGCGRQRFYVTKKTFLGNVRAHQRDLAEQKKIPWAKSIPSPPTPYKKRNRGYKLASS